MSLHVAISGANRVIDKQNISRLSPSGVSRLEVYIQRSNLHEVPETSR